MSFPWVGLRLGVIVLFLLFRMGLWLTSRASFTPLILLKVLCGLCPIILFFFFFYRIVPFKNEVEC